MFEVDGYTLASIMFANDPHPDVVGDLTPEQVRELHDLWGVDVVQTDRFRDGEDLMVHEVGGLAVRVLSGVLTFFGRELKPIVVLLSGTEIADVRLEKQGGGSENLLALCTLRTATRVCLLVDPKLFEHIHIFVGEDLVVNLDLEG